MDTLTLVRGLPGSGKSSLVEMMDNDDDGNLFTSFFAFSADDFFINVLGEYHFDPSKLTQAHAQCQADVLNVLKISVPEVESRILIHNTFSCRWEMEPYIKMAEQFGVRLIVVDLFDGGLTDEQLFARNVHGVPLATIQQMRRRWEHDWKNGDVRPPWERKK